MKDEVHSKLQEVREQLRMAQVRVAEVRAHGSLLMGQLAKWVGQMRSCQLQQLED